MSGFTASMVWDWKEMQAWILADAYILDTDLVESDSDDGVTYRVTATYTYSFGGREYTGTRVAVQDVSDNLGNFHHEAQQTLESHRRAGEPMPCYVNPEQPEEAVLYRDLRAGVLALFGGLGAVFTLVGLGVMIAGVAGGRMVRRRQENRAQAPGQPWLWKEDWRKGVIRSSNTIEMIGSLVFAVLWNGVSWLPLFIVPVPDDEGKWVLLILLLFPAIGVGMAIWAARCVIRWRKFGEMAFYMASVPGVTGGYLEGMIRIPRPIRPDADFRLTLRCLKRVTTGSGKNKTTTDHVVWEHEHALPPNQMLQDATQCAVPVRFAIPYDTPQSAPDDTPPILWKLEASAPMPGVDFSATFEVPVFRTETSNPDFDPAQEAPASGAREFTMDERLASAGVETQPLAGGGMRFRFPRAQHIASLLVALLLFAVFAGIAAGLIITGAAPIIGAIFGVLGGIMGLVFLDQALSYVEVEAETHALRVRGGFIGLGGQKHIDPAAITEIEYKESMKINGQPYFSVFVKCGEGKPVRISRHIRGAENTEAYVQALWRAMGQGERG